MKCKYYLAAIGLACSASMPAKAGDAILPMMIARACGHHHHVGGLPHKHVSKPGSVKKVSLTEDSVLTG